MAFAGYGSAGHASARLRCGPLRFGHTTQRDGGDQHVRLARVGGIPAGGFGGTLQTVADRIGMSSLAVVSSEPPNFRNVETVSSVGSSGPAAVRLP